MPHTPKLDPKSEALRACGALNPRPEDVADDLFLSHEEFFDRRDLVQVKYEMLRRVHVEHAPVAQVAAAFGFSRPTFYQSQEAYVREGLPGLLPRKRGPHGGHKLTCEVLEFVDEARRSNSATSVAEIVPLLEKRFGITVHPRSVERALERRAKKAQ